MKATNGALRELSQNCGSQWITFRQGHQVDFAAKLGGGELSELARKVLTNADHEVFLTGFQFLKSQTETTAEGRLVRPRTLDLALGVLLPARVILTKDEFSVNYG